MIEISSVIVAVVALVALAIAFVLRREVLAADQGTPKMQEIAKAVQEGAAAYLKRQFRTLGSSSSSCSCCCSCCPPTPPASGSAARSSSWSARCSPPSIGYFGMWLATRANIRVAAAAREDGGREKAMRIAFRTGGVGRHGHRRPRPARRLRRRAGLHGRRARRCWRASASARPLLAMFMRVGGGIFTKAADVGADLVGKVEQGIPEDDPRNAATIADNVGDNVGDCAGMAADLFESYAVTLVASLILGTAAFGAKGLVFPLIVPGHRRDHRDHRRLHHPRPGRTRAA